MADNESAIGIATLVASICTGVAILIKTVTDSILLLRNGRQIQTVADKVDEVHRSTNGMKDELVAATAVAARAAGREEEIQRVRAERKQHQ